MPSDEKSRKHHEESDSEEDEEVEIVPKVDIDVSKLTPLSPEVISKQVSADCLRISLSFSGISSGYHQSWCAYSLSIVEHCTYTSLGCRHHRACRARQIDRSESNIRGNDRPLQE